jgi:alkylation response protein AidB-like acyl-CoA dehydrogenase
MIADRPTSPHAARAYALEPALRALAHSDAHGVPLAGRAAELAALRATGAGDLSLGRILEGHLNGAQLIARCGTPAQRAAMARAIDAGLLFGVWNTQDEPLRIERHGARLVLRGAKTWASGAGSIARPVITAAWPDGAIQLCVIAMESVDVRIDATRWAPLGMHASDSFAVDFSGVELAPDDLIGAPGDYERQPWFFGGALRFAAVQTGAIERLTRETSAYLRKRGRAGDALQTARLGEMRIAAATARLWLDAGATAWQRFDAEPTPRHAAAVLESVDMARTVVERAALETIERAVRSVGARGLVEPEPFAAIVRDLQMYLRQPAPDAALARVGRAELADES